MAAAKLLRHSKSKIHSGFWILWSQDLVYQGFTSWKANTLNFNCHLLLLWHGHQQISPNPSSWSNPAIFLMRWSPWCVNAIAFLHFEPKASSQHTVSHSVFPIKRLYSQELSEWAVYLYRGIHKHESINWDEFRRHLGK